MPNLSLYRYSSDYIAPVGPHTLTPTAASLKRVMSWATLCSALVLCTSTGSCKSSEGQSCKVPADCVAGLHCGTDQRCQREPCGDPAIVKRFARCNRSPNRVSCEDAGGQWRNDGRCACWTGQADCPCVEDSDCFAQCRFSIPEGGDCSKAERKTCSAGTFLGSCYCASVDGKMMRMCASYK